MTENTKYRAGQIVRFNTHTDLGLEATILEVEWDEFRKAYTYIMSNDHWCYEWQIKAVIGEEFA